mmetsp:Transcript_62707/g.130355  ORF Transcript_62707/g.130355 Transcript_62707/m.130355 type:complete len:182 (-) Transcript_62707:499-1044(-)
MRRASECFISRAGAMGLRRDHVSYVRDSHVTLFLQAMKNDPYSRGNEVFLAWVTASGIPIGDTLQRYERRLEECWITQDAPFLLPTAGQGGFILPRSGRGFRPDACLRSGLKACFAEFGDPVLLKRFSWHSLRRGGASHAWREGVDMRLLMAHGIWHTEAGVLQYMAPDFTGKLEGVTGKM